MGTNSLPQKTKARNGLPGRPRSRAVPIYLDEQGREDVEAFLTVRLMQRTRYLDKFLSEWDTYPESWRRPVKKTLENAIAEIRRLISTVKHPIAYTDPRTGETTDA